MQTKQQKRAKADASNLRWRSLTSAQQIAELAKRPGNSQRQIDRIKKQTEQ